MSITREFRILDKTITVHFSDENHAEKYFDFSSLDSEWHKRQIGEYHLTMLLGCLRAYWYFFMYDREFTLEQKGIFLIGNIFHKHIQDHLEKTLGFVIIECPCEDELDEDVSILFKIDIIEIREKELADIKTTRYMPIISDLTYDKFEKKFGKYILQVLAQIYFVNNTYFKCDPMETIKILYVDKFNLFTKSIWLDYDEKLAEYFYLKIRARANYLHEHISTGKVPDNCDPSDFCMWCAFVDLCPEGTEIKNSLTVPVNPESVAFKKKHGQNKKPYWKYDPDAKKWLKSKGFVDFILKELKYTNEQFAELD